MSSSESTLKCAYGAGTSRGCQPAMTGTKEHSEKPLCGTLPDWNVWCIGGAGGGIAPDAGSPLFSVTHEGGGPPPPAGAHEGWGNPGLLGRPPPCLPPLGYSPR